VGTDGSACRVGGGFAEPTIPLAGAVTVEHIAAEAVGSAKESGGFGKVSTHPTKMCKNLFDRAAVDRRLIL
jgi:hypothetical protein